MALARDTVAEHIKPLGGMGGPAGFPPPRKVTLGATTAAGQIVSLQSDSKWDPAIGTGVVSTGAVCVTAGVDGDRVDVVTFGPVECLTGATIGALVYVSDTAGEPSHTAGTKSAVIGYAESATTLFVQFQTVAFA